MNTLGRLAKNSEFVPNETEGPALKPDGMRVAGGVTLRNGGKTQSGPRMTTWEGKMTREAYLAQSGRAAMAKLAAAKGGTRAGAGMGMGMGAGGKRFGAGGIVQQTTPTTTLPTATKAKLVPDATDGDGDDGDDGDQGTASSAVEAARREVMALLKDEEVYQGLSASATLGSTVLPRWAADAVYVVPGEGGDRGVEELVKSPVGMSTLLRGTAGAGRR